MNGPSAAAADFRNIVLRGANVASYKFALAKSALSLAESGLTSVSLEDLAVPFGRELCTRQCRRTCPSRLDSAVLTNGKLVRDFIPDVIRASGRTAEVRTLSAEEYLSALCAKLIEESHEAVDAVDDREKLIQESNVTEKHGQRFEVEPGSLPSEWRCGTNGDQIKGIRRVQDFQPTYFTADWKDGVLVQVVLWGPRILDDGSLGKRELDYRWKKTAATGPVRYRDLPSPLRSRLLEYNQQMGFTVLPEQL